MEFGRRLIYTGAYFWSIFHPRPILLEIIACAYVSDDNTIIINYKPKNKKQFRYDSNFNNL